MTRPLSAADSLIGILKSEGMQRQIADALPKHCNADRMIRIAMTELRKNPKIAQTDPKSFLGAVIQSAQLGLEIGSGLGHYYLIPYKRECQLIIGYQGQIEIAMRSSLIKSIAAQVIRDGDEFEYLFDSTKGGFVLKWKPDLSLRTVKDSKDNTLQILATAELTNGGTIYEVMSAQEIETIRQSSPGKNSDPWTKHWGEMAKKTAIRRLYKRLPKSTEMRDLVNYENSIESGASITDIATPLAIPEIETQSSSLDDLLP